MPKNFIKKGKKQPEPHIFGTMKHSVMKGLGGHEVKAPSMNPKKKKDKSFARAIIGKE